MSAECEESLFSTDSESDPCPGPQHGKDGKHVPDQESNDGEELFPKKRCGPNVAREWEEVNGWLRDDRLKQLFHVELCYLTVQSGGFDSLRRQDRVTKSSEWEGWCSRRQWTTSNGFTAHTMLNCPFVKLTDCKCHVKIIESPAMLVIYVADNHSLADHKDGKSKAPYHKPMQIEIFKNFVRKPIHTIC
jgi:hypothetical protein